MGLTNAERAERELQRVAQVMADFGISDTDDVSLSDVLRGYLSQAEVERDTALQAQQQAKEVYGDCTAHYHMWHTLGEEPLSHDMCDCRAMKWLDRGLHHRTGYKYSFPSPAGDRPRRPEGPLTTCASERNPYQARCGAKFCSYEDMAHHEKKYCIVPVRGASAALKGAE